MKKGFYQYFFDLRMVFKRPVNIICLILFLIAMIGVNLSHLSSGPVGAIYTCMKLIYPFSTGLAILLSIRLYNSQTIDTLKAYPLSFTWILGGKWLSVMTYMTLYTMVTLAIFGWGALSWDFQGPVFWNIVNKLFMSMEITYGFSITLGLFIASLLRHHTAYLAGVMVWLCGTFLIPFLLPEKLLWLPFKVNPLKNAVLNNDPEWGLALTQQEQTKIIWVLIALMLIFFIGTVTTSIKQRPIKYSYAPIISLIAAVFIVGASLFTHFEYWSHQLGDLKEHHTVSIPKAKAVNYPLTPYTVNDYLIDVFKDDYLWTFHSKLSIDIPEVPSTGMLSFTINPDFSIEQVTVNGKIVDYDQHDGWIDLSFDDFDPNAAQQNLSFIYSGRLEEWGYDGESGKETWFGFTRGDSFYVPAYLAWYPLPGRIPLYINESKNVYSANLSSALTSKPATYTIRIHGFDQPVFTTSLLQSMTKNNVEELAGTNQTGVTLFGGTFKTWESKNVSVLFPAYYDHVRTALTSQIGSMRDFLEDTFKMPIAGKFVCLPIGGNQQNAGDAFTFPCSLFDQLSNPVVSDEMERNLIDDFLSDGQFLTDQFGASAQLNIDYILAVQALYHYEHTDSEPQISSSEKNDSFIQQVIDALNQDQTEQVKKFLRTLYEDQKDPTHPIITREDWMLTWNDVYQKGV